MHPARESHFQPQLPPPLRSLLQDDIEFVFQDGCVDCDLRNPIVAKQVELMKQLVLSLSFTGELPGMGPVSELAAEVLGLCSNVADETRERMLPMSCLDKTVGSGNYSFVNVQ